jgi:hypothetical protein
VALAPPYPDDFVYKVIEGWVFFLQSLACFWNFSFRDFINLFFIV